MQRFKDTSAFSAITLSESNGVPKRVQVLRTGKFKHPKYGEFEITPLKLAEMKKNFDDNIRGIDTAFDYFHESGKEAAAWVKSLMLEEREGGTVLFAEVDWTPAAEKKLADRELRYFSPDFAFKWTDPETQTNFNNVLFGGGLTNRPFVKGMDAIVAHEGDDDMDLKKQNETLAARVKELEGQNLKLSEDMTGMTKKLEEANPEAEALKAQIAELQAKLDAITKEKEVLLSDKAKADEAKMLAEQESEFNLMLSEGKACAAQKEAFMKKDFKAFAKLAQPVNLQGSGNSGSGEGAITLSLTDEAGIMKLAEERHAKNPEAEFGSIVSGIRKEIRDKKV